MVDFAYVYGVEAEIELIEPGEIEAAWARLQFDDVRYRIVVDLRQIGKD